MLIPRRSFLSLVVLLLARATPSRALWSNTSFITHGNATHAVDASGGQPAIAIIDYGESVEGIPAFDIVNADGDTSVFEITYAESKAALSQYMSDGPLPLAAGMDTYRVNRYSIQGPGTVKGRLIQGAFRYQKLNLSSSGSLTIRNIGVHATIETTPISELPGTFHCSDEDINRIWTAGARTIQMTEIPKNTIPDFVEVTPDGTLVDSLAPQVAGSIDAAQAMYYSMVFRVKPLAGGFGFMVLSDTLNSGIYISCDVEKRRITSHAGSTTMNDVLESFDIPNNVSISLGEWHSVHADVAMTNVTVTIDGVEVMKLSQASRFVGSFGFGASFGHRAMFRDLSVTTIAGQELFSHSLTDRSYLPDFFMGQNPHDTVVDGSRRDRIAYTGDLDVAGAAGLASTHGIDYIIGSLNLVGSYQATPGFFIPTAKIQQEPYPGPLSVNITGLIGYSFNLLTAIASTYAHTGDVNFAKKWASPVQKMLDWAASQTLENGLFNISDATFGGDWNYYDPPQSGVVTKFNVLYAYSLQECKTLLADAGVDVAVYEKRLNGLRHAIDNNLWSDELNAYYVSENVKDGYAQDSNAIAILAGVNVNPKHSTELILGSMKDLIGPSGPLAFSEGVLASGFRNLISPYASAYHLRAAMASNDSESALRLLKNLWQPMTDKSNANYTGTFWETLDENGRPGLGLTTSLCHGWAAGPTAELSKHVLGAAPTKPGWFEFQVAPLTLGLRWAKGRVPTSRGSPITVEWTFDCHGLLNMVVEAPAGTKGQVLLPTPLVVGLNESIIEVNGETQSGDSFVIEGGTKVVLIQSLR